MSAMTIGSSVMRPRPRASPLSAIPGPDEVVMASADTGEQEQERAAKKAAAEEEKTTRRAAEDKDVALMGILHSAKFGASEIIELLAKYTKDHIVADTINIFQISTYFIYY